MTTPLVATDAWRTEFPGAVAGALVLRDVANPERSAALDDRKRELERKLRDGPEPLPIMRAYEDYYRARGQTYHVKAQLASIVAKGKPIPGRAALVEAMFMAELQNLVLTAGHDLAALEPPVHIDATRPGDRYTTLGGKDAELGAGDMKMVDRRGIISSILRGPDQRTHITPRTRAVLFAVYAPPAVGAETVERHLEDIRANVLLIAPEAQTEALATLTAE